VDVVRGTVLHCSKFGAVVRLDDGRLASLPPDVSGMATIRRASTAGRKPHFPFVIEEEQGRHLRLGLAEEAVDVDVESATPVRASSSSLDQKIIDYLRQTAEWDPRATSEASRADERPRSDRLLPFEFRARRQYRDSPERPRRPKR
jgi:hypothetical protein